jgi:hypothetical protein
MRRIGPDRAWILQSLDRPKGSSTNWWNVKVTLPDAKHFNFQRLAFNRTELALSLGVSVNTVDIMVTEGFLPPARRWHTRKLWIVAEVQAYLSEWPTADARAVTASEWRATA